MKSIRKLLCETKQKKKEKGLLNRISGFCESSQMELKHTNTFYDERQENKKY